MAIPRPPKKDYHECTFCKMYPCMYVKTNDIEYGNRCRNYMADNKKIDKDKMSGNKSKYSFLN